MPHPLAQRIDQLARRISRQRWRAALGWVVAVALAVAGGLMLADYAYRSHDTGLRWLAAVALDVAIVYAFYRFAGPLWRRPVTEQAVAQEVQQQFPKLGSRLASALEFLQQPTDDPQAGSQELRRAVVVDTASEVEQLPIETIANPIPARRAIAAALLAVAGLVVFGLSDPGGIKIAAGRLLAPWSDLEWPRRHHLTVVDVKTRIARGGPFEATVVDLNGALPDDLQVIYRSESKGSERLDTQPLPIAGKEGVARRENVKQPFAFRIVGGDDDTMEWTEVRVVDPPTVGELAIKAHPPAYTRLPTENVGLDLRLLAGTQLALTAHSPQELSSAAIEITTGEEVYLVPAEVIPSQEKGSRIHLPAERWIATPQGDQLTNSRYRLRIEDAEGLLGRTESRRMVVEPDPLPEVTWETPSSDAFVTAGAEVPVSVRVSDNLAVEWVELVAEHSGGEDASPPAQRVRIYTGPTTPPEPNASNEILTAQVTWSLAPLELAEGDALLLTVEAADYRPGIGRTAVTRRLTIISTAELEARIAEGATALARQLERALADQRSVRDASRSIEADRRAAKPIDRAVSDRLTTLGYEQRQVAKALSDEMQGAGEQAGRLLDEINNNGLARPELVEQLHQVEQEVARLAAGPLPDADRGLADARREAERLADREASDPQDKANEAIGQSLAATDQEQTKVVESLEGLVDGLGQWTDRQRFVREAAELERGQRELAAETRQAAAHAAAAPNDAATRATQQKIAEAQAELSRRFDRLQRGLRDKVLQSQNDAATNPPGNAAPMEDALAETDERATGGKMADASRRLERGQMGRAAEQQASAAEDLQRMLDTLRNQAPRDPKQLAEALREAAEELADLRQQAAQEASPADGNRQAERQKQQREQLADQAERMGRKLERLSAEAAGQSAGESGEQMDQAASQSQSSPQDASQSMEQADQKLADAQQQLQQRQEEVENQITQTVLEKLAGKIDGYIARQRSVLEGAVLAADAADEPRREATARLAGDERSLQQLITAVAEELSSRAVFAMALGSASEEMQQTAKRLEVADASRTTQRKARSALQRLQHIAQVLKPDPNLPPPDSEQQQSPAGGGQGDGKQPPPPPVDVAELKMLRLMQLDLNAQTRALEADTAESLLSQSESRATAARLAIEQDKLADLVRELAARDNAPTEPSPLETN